ncbi:MAG: glycosyltransferase family 39 protein, partial [Dehalococcoidia bacterium]|nr:glycosyltransferase family 39 protein [Dehalococcoidia bacterium]
LNAISVLTVYLLAHRLTHSHTAALLSGLIVGLVSSMPAYYVNWGRYTQMTGQVILPVAVFLAMEAVEKRSGAYATLAAVAAAGLFLTHYRVILFYVAFLAVYYAWRLATNRSPKDSLQSVPGRDAPLGRLPFHKRQLSHLVDTVWLTGIGIIALALVFPRLWYLAANLPRGEASVPQLSPEAWDNWMISYNSLGDLTYYVGWPLILFTGAGFIWALIRKEKAGPIMGGWVVLLFAMANSERLGLSRGAWLNNFAVVIALYMPASILAGWVGAQTIGMVGRAWRPARYTLAMLAAAAGIWGAWGMANIVDGKYVLVTPTDQRAMDWIKINTSPDARFLVNYFFAYGGKYVVGSDGGWWLYYLTGRESTVPPILYGAESSPQRDYAPRVNAIARSLQDNVYTREGLLLMREEGITHIFIGEKGGFLDPNKLLSNGHQAVYRDGPVWVFKVNYSSATP